ncbi:MAG: AI-2E family transporter [Pirellulales bacterium]|nr:AI-2E family transporter [Pirellulales bacterium]
MARMVSFIVLVVLLVAVAALFFKVMAGFILPLFLAVLLVVMFRPLHQWFVARLKGHDRWAAALTTVAILLIFLIPLLFIIVQGIAEGIELSRDLDVNKIDRQAVARAVNGLNERFDLELSADEIQKEAVERIQAWLTPLLVSTTQYALSMVVGLCIMVIALYYFLADGPGMVSAVMRLSPLADRYETQLIEEFDSITRAVVLASVVSAVAQGILAGIGYYFAGLGAIFLLTVLTMLFAMVPFVGATAIWAPCCVWLYFHGQPVAAIALALYGALVVSLVDNLIKPMILHGRSNIHPLLALLSILGGVKVLGPIGIFVGPMVVTFLHTVLLMLQKEIALLGQQEKKASPAKAAR